MMTSRMAVVIAIAVAGTFGQALAQSRAGDTALAYPVRPVRVIVPYSPGGSMDGVARILSARFPELLGQPMLIENRPGVAGVLGGELVAKSVPDGYTLLIDGSPLAINPHVLKEVRFDPLRDLTPISLLANAPNVLVVNPQFPARSVRELVASATLAPGSLTYGSGGAGTITHLTGELFKLAARVDLLHVPYKSIANATTDVLGGQIPMAFPVMPGVAPHIRAGRLRALAISSDRRSGALPDVATFVELGFQGVVVGNWFGLLGPARLPREIVGRLNKLAGDVVRSPEGQGTFASLGFDIIASTPEVFERQLRFDVDKWAGVVKAAGIKPE